MRQHYDLGPELTRGELIAGLIYLPFYVFLIAWLLGAVSRGTGLDLSSAQINLIYCYINFAAVVIIFHRFLANSFRSILHGFWNFVQAIILGFALYYAGNFLLGLVFGLLAPNLQNPADANAMELIRANGKIMLVCAVFLGPLVEECLMRGLIFGTLQPRSRIAAYAVSCVVFAALHLWQYAGDVSAAVLLADAVLYIPAGIALGWTYEKAGTIWAPILLHAYINALSVGLISMQ